MLNARGEAREHRKAAAHDATAVRKRSPELLAPHERPHDEKHACEKRVEQEEVLRHEPQVRNREQARIHRPAAAAPRLQHQQGEGNGEQGQQRIHAHHQQIRERHAACRVDAHGEGRRNLVGEQIQRQLVQQHQRDQKEHKIQSQARPLGESPRGKRRYHVHKPIEKRRMHVLGLVVVDRCEREGVLPAGHGNVVEEVLARDHAPGKVAAEHVAQKRGEIAVGQTVGVDLVEEVPLLHAAEIHPHGQGQDQDRAKRQVPSATYPEIRHELPPIDRSGGRATCAAPKRYTIESARTNTRTSEADAGSPSASRRACAPSPSPRST